MLSMVLLLVSRLQLETVSWPFFIFSKLRKNILLSPKKFLAGFLLSYVTALWHICTLRSSSVQLFHMCILDTFKFCQAFLSYVTALRCIFTQQFSLLGHRNCVNNELQTFKYFLKNWKIHNYVTSILIWTKSNAKIVFLWVLSGDPANNKHVQREINKDKIKIYTSKL